MNEHTYSLAELAQRINQEHEQCCDAFTAGLQHALNAGDLLIQAKALCEHGEWGAWLAVHCSMSERTAQSYMRVARNREAIEAKAQRVADLSMREALLMLSEPRRSNGNPYLEGGPIDDFEKVMAEWQAIEPGLLKVLDNPRAKLSDLNLVVSIAGMWQNRIAESRLRMQRTAGELVQLLAQLEARCVRDIALEAVDDRQRPALMQHRSLTNA